MAGEPFGSGTVHRANTTLEGLVLIDWVFHLTLIVGAAVIGAYLYKTLAWGQTTVVDTLRHVAAAQTRP